MGVVKMIECDSPNCNEIGHPEHLDKQGKVVNGPYGWIQATVRCVGNWEVRVFVCQIGHLEDAVEFAQDEAEGRGGG